MTSVQTDPTLVTSPAQPRGNKRAREDIKPADNSILDRIVNRSIRDSPTFFDLSTNRRRSDRLKGLTTKFYLIRDREDLDRVETYYAEDITIPKNHVQATKSAFTVQWINAENDEMTGLKKERHARYCR